MGLTDRPAEAAAKRHGPRGDRAADAEPVPPAGGEAPTDGLTCADARELLPLLRGEELGRTNAQRLRAHLAGCFECSRDLGAYLRSLRALEELGERGRGCDRAPDAEFFSDLKQRILASTSALGAPAAVARTVVRQRLAAACAAVSLLAIGLGIVQLTSSGAPRLLGNTPIAVPARPAPDANTPFSDLSRRTNLGARTNPNTARESSYGLSGRMRAARYLEALLVGKRPGPGGGSSR